MSDNLRPPKETIGDDIHVGISSIIGSFPVAGNIAEKIFNTVIVPPYTKRLEEWRKNISETVIEVCSKKGLSLDELSQNNVFIDIVTEASHAALKTSQKEKKKALKNAIINTILDDNPDESMSHMFIRFIDDFTYIHIKALQLAYCPENVARDHNKCIEDIRNRVIPELLQELIPKLKDNRELVDQVINDLHSKGLIQKQYDSTVLIDKDGFHQSYRTNLGIHFYNFVTLSEDDKYS